MTLGLASPRPARAVGIIPNESQRLRRQVGFSDLAIVARIEGVDTVQYGSQTPPGTGTILHLKLERRLSGPDTDSLLDVRGPERTGPAGGIGMRDLVARNMGLRPGARQVFLLRNDPRKGLCLMPGGLLEIQNDTIVVESKWAGRRWFENVARPLQEDGVPVRDHIRVDDLAAWFQVLDARATEGMRHRRATLIAGGRLVAEERGCNVPQEMHCFALLVDTVFSADLDSLRRADAADTTTPTPQPGVARTFLAGAHPRQIIRVMLSATYLSWLGYHAYLWLEPGPGNLWVPAYDGAGFQPVRGGVYLRKIGRAHV